MRANLAIQPPVVVAPMALPPLEMRTIRVTLAHRFQPRRMLHLSVKVVRAVCRALRPIRQSRKRRRVAVRRVRGSSRAGPERPRLAKAGAWPA